MNIPEDAINDAFNSWLEKYNFSARVYGMDYEFGYYPEENDITYSFLYIQEVENHWNEFVASLGCRYEMSHFWTSFFHELGHSETMHLLTKEELDYSASRAVVANNAEYFELPREIIATKWAVNFINNEIDKVMELINMLRPLMEEIIN
jgi:hypothetical protein